MTDDQQRARELFRKHGGNPDHENTVVRAALAAITAALRAAPEGFVMVPGHYAENAWYAARVLEASNCAIDRHNALAMIELARVLAARPQGVKDDN
ncbi:hypothetical protein [Stenotrophomonas sp.]|uniref:hypothetical protein n=1 Tax=Stenotrophomonas sp. TaxID=69392 RepID=UPI0028AEC536|nr:hypothetical protein [Stenotrophomonas sp.]